MENKPSPTDWWSPHTWSYMSMMYAKPTYVPPVAEPHLAFSLSLSFHDQTLSPPAPPPPPLSSFSPRYGVLLPPPSPAAAPSAVATAAAASCFFLQVCARPKSVSAPYLLRSSVW
jgi:hypothetical protein